MTPMACAAWVWCECWGTICTMDWSWRRRMENLLPGIPSAWLFQTRVNPGGQCSCSTQPYCDRRVRGGRRSTLTSQAPAPCWAELSWPLSLSFFCCWALSLAFPLLPHCRIIIPFWFPFFLFFLPLNSFFFFFLRGLGWWRWWWWRCCCFGCLASGCGLGDGHDAGDVCCRTLRAGMSYPLKGLPLYVSKGRIWLFVCRIWHVKSRIRLLKGRIRPPLCRMRTYKCRIRLSEVEFDITKCAFDLQGRGKTLPICVRK